jgi:hypothetical protein
MLMPEVLVTVFTPNRQSLFGVIELAREAALYRARSDDLRPLLVYPLPSRIESLEPALRQSWRYGNPDAGIPGFQRLFEQTFREIYDLPNCDLSSYFDDVQIQHVPAYAYGEEIALLIEETRDRFSLTQSYLRFSARLVRGTVSWAGMTSGQLPQLPELVGFFSYSREDDEAFRGSLSALRDAIQRELSAQLGRTNRINFRLWQDQEAIAPGEMWESEIAKAVEQSVFFIPIVTPRAVASRHCKFEFESFLARERALDHNDLVFPILYIHVPALLDEAQWRDDPVLSFVAHRQCVDWRSFRRVSVDTPAFGQAIEAFCSKIVETLRKPLVSPEERDRLEAEARRRAEDEERIRQEGESKRKAAEQVRLRNETRQQRGTLKADVLAQSMGGTSSPKIRKVMAGESLVGNGNEVAHIDLIIGPRGSAAETASPPP